MGVHRYHSTSVNIDGTIYLFGGNNFDYNIIGGGSNYVSDKVSMLSSDFNRIIPFEYKMRKPRHQHRTIQLNDNVIIHIGGFSNTEDANSEIEIWEFDHPGRIKHFSALDGWFNPLAFIYT